MKRIPHRGAMILAILALSAAGLYAQPSISRVTNIPRITFDPDGTASSSGAVRIRCGGYYGVCTVVLVDLGYTPTQAPPLEGVVYTAWKDSGTEQLTITTTPSGPDEVLQYTFPAGTAKSTKYDVPFEVYAEPTTFPVAGTYTVSMRADLYASDFPLGTVVSTVNFTFDIKVNSNAALSIVDQGDPFIPGSTSKPAIFQAGIYEGAEAYIDAIARTNTGYSLHVASTNGSILTTVSDPNTIPYTLTSNTIPVNFGTNPNLEPLASGIATGAAGKRYALVFKISPYTEIPVAETYTDILTFTLTAP